MFRWIAKIFGQGLLTVIPLSLTVAVVVWIGVTIEGLLSNPFQKIFPWTNQFYSAGMGIAVFITLSFLLGLLMNLWVVQRLFRWFEKKIESLPVVKTVYGAIKDITKFFGGGQKNDGSKMVVMVTNWNGWRQIGIVTRQDFNDVSPQLAGGHPDMIAVYVPLSYQIGGNTYFIDRAACEPVPDMTVEDAMRYSAMAWMSATPQDPAKN